jgi:hypothetical protein
MSTPGRAMNAMKRWRGRVRSASVACLVGPLLVGATARAQDDATRAAARTLAYEGNAAYERGDDAVAIEKLDKAYSLVPVPVLGVSSARARVRLGKLVTAAERYRQVTRLSEGAVSAAGAGLNLTLQQQAQAQAEAELQALLPRIPQLVLAISGAAPGDVVVRLDGARLPAVLVGESVPLDPGAHRLEAWHGKQRLVRELVLAEGARETLRLHFERPALPARPANADAELLQRVSGWSLVGLGGAVAMFGVAGHVYLADQKGEIERNGGGELACPSNDRSPCDRYNSGRQFPPIAIVAGSVLAATGGFLLVWPWAAEQLELGLAVAPDADRSGVSVFATLRTDSPVGLRF